MVYHRVNLLDDMVIGMNNIKQGDFFTAKKAGVCNDQSPPFRFEVTNGWSYAATTPYVYTVLRLCQEIHLCPTVTQLGDKPEGSLTNNSLNT